jgi:flagellar biosynthesis protein FlhB
MAENDEKIHEPTEQKLDKARKRGDIIYSPEVGAALSLAALTGLVAFLAAPIADETARSLIGFIQAPAQYATDQAALSATFADIGLRMLLIFGTTALVIAAAGVAARYLQDKPTFTAERLNPKLDKLSPIEGFKRVFGKAAASGFLKALAKLTLVGVVLVWTLWPRDAQLERIGFIDPAALLPYVQDRAVAMLMALAAAAALLAVIDYVMTRQSYIARQRMTPQELKEEHKEQSGDPQVKAKLFRIRAERAKRRMLQNMNKASVVITNPTHYAVALRYEPGETAAPVCLAKGVDAVAQRIREVAEEFGVPIVENPPLARALFAAADLDQPIPPEHYQAVAKIIGFVMRLGRKKAAARRPPPSARRP